MSWDAEDVALGFHVRSCALNGLKSDIAPCPKTRTTTEVAVLFDRHVEVNLAHLTFARFQRDLLGEHDIFNRQTADGFLD